MQINKSLHRVKPKAQTFWYFDENSAEMVIPRCLIAPREILKIFKTARGFELWPMERFAMPEIQMASIETDTPLVYQE